MTKQSPIISDVEEVFRALADPTRRQILDALFDHDGQTLTELCGQIPTMTRFGVMKHLALLEAAHLVTARRDGREKFHYLNPVPIVEIHDRWVSKYAAPFVSALTALKRDAEADATRNAAESPTTRSRHTRSA